MYAVHPHQSRALSQNHHLKINGIHPRSQQHFAPSYCVPVYLPVFAEERLRISLVDECCQSPGPHRFQALFLNSVNKTCHNAKSLPVAESSLATFCRDVGDIGDI